MPIKRELKMFYPADWLARSRAAKERAGFKCELCGAPDRQFIRRFISDPFVWRSAGSVVLDDNLRFRPSTFVVLTVAHKDHRLVDHEPSNLFALCQRCHLLYDRPFVGRVDPRPAAFQTDRLFAI